MTDSEMQTDKLVTFLFILFAIPIVICVAMLGTIAVRDRQIEEINRELQTKQEQIVKLTTLRDYCEARRK